MTWIVTVSLIVAIVAIAGAFFRWANGKTQKQHAEFTTDDVINAIDNVFSGDYHDEWDLFLAWPINDPYLESIRQECLLICKEHAGKEKGKDIESAGEAKLRIILEGLTKRA